MGRAARGGKFPWEDLSSADRTVHRKTSVTCTFTPVVCAEGHYQTRFSPLLIDVTVLDVNTHNFSLCMSKLCFSPCQKQNYLWSGNKCITYLIIKLSSLYSLSHLSLETHIRKLKYRLWLLCVKRFYNIFVCKHHSVDSLFSCILFSCECNLLV